MGEVTRILAQIKDGEENSIDNLFSIVYGEMKRLAEHHLRGEDPHHTLKPTALVHEVYLRLFGTDKPMEWESTKHFFGAASRSMRQILVDWARAKRAAKRFGNKQRVELDETAKSVQGNFFDILSVNEALAKFAKIGAHERMVKLVEFRFFVGLTLEQAADVLEISHSQAKRDWRLARAWLLRHLPDSSE